MFSAKKPMTWEITEAEELERMAREKDLLGVAYAYSGYHMVKFAKMLVDEGKLGKIINVNGEYPQEWLIDELSETISKTQNSPAGALTPRYPAYPTAPATSARTLSIRCPTLPVCVSSASLRSYRLFPKRS